MLKIEKGSGRLEPVPRVSLRSRPVDGEHDLSALIKASPEGFFEEIDEKLFRLAVNTQLSHHEPPGDGLSARIDLLAVDAGGCVVAVLVEGGREPAFFVRALLSADLLGRREAGSFIEGLPTEQAERLNEFLAGGWDRINHSQRLILVSERHAPETLFAGQTLRQQHGLDITLLRATVAVDSRTGDEYLSVRRQFPALTDGAPQLFVQDGATEIEIGSGRDRPSAAAEPSGAHTVPPEVPQATLSPDAKSEALRTLAGGFADYLGQTMAAIIGSAELAERESPQGAVRQRLDEVTRAAERAAKLADQLGVYAGQGTRRTETLDIARLVEHVSESVHGLLLPNVEFRSELPQDLPAVRGDADLLRQAITHLLRNAVEALPEHGGKVSMEAAAFSADHDYLKSCRLSETLAAGEYLRVVIQDTGFGMDEQTVEHAFDPFFSTKSRGRGLGLSAVMGIVRGHGGALRMDSKPGEGTTVAVLFPLAAKQPAFAGDSSPKTANATVLFVDGLETVRAMAQETLESHGFQALSAADGWEALETFSAKADIIDVVVLDWMLPQMDIEEAFRAVRRLRPDVGIVITSSFSELEASQRFDGKRLTAWLRKPIDAATLIGTVRRILQEREAASTAAAS